MQIPACRLRGILCAFLSSRRTAPTRELADQTAEALSNFAAKTPLRVGVVYGGVDIKPQIEQVRKGVEVLIATPGRLLDHLEQKSTNLNQVSIVVLDEADRMLDTADRKSVV